MAIIHNNVLIEVSKPNASGFQSSYLQCGPNMRRVVNGQMDIAIEVEVEDKPQLEPKDKSPKKNQGKAKPPAKGKNAKKKKRNDAVDLMSSDSEDDFLPSSRDRNNELVELISDEESDDNGNDANVRSRSVGRKRPLNQGKMIAGHVLDNVHEDKLIKILQEARKEWAKMFNEAHPDAPTLFYWNAMDTATVRKVAEMCPTTIQELKESKTMADEKIENFGENIVLTINTFIGENDLGHLIDKKHENKAKEANRKKPRNSGDSLADLDKFRMNVDK
mgnify:CR=1 FL=1